MTNDQPTSENEETAMGTGDANEAMRSVTPSHTWRRTLASFLGVVAAMSLVLAVTSTWMTNTVLDTDKWVNSVEPLPEDPELQQIIAELVADEALTLVDLSALMENAFGTAGRFLAAPAQDATRGFIENATVRVLASAEFETIWIEANRVAHEAAVKVLRGDVAAANIVDGKVMLDLVPLINNVVAEVSADVPELFGGAIAVPEVTADEVDQATTTLADALGVTIPPGFGQVPVFDANALGDAQRVVRWLDDGSVALWVIFGLALVGSIAASIDRRRTVMFTGIVTAVTAVIIWVLRRPLETDIVNEIKNPTGKQATQIVIDVALWKNLGPLIAALVIVSLVAAVIAYLTGPSNAAVAFRRTVVGLFRGHHSQTAASIFLRRHTTAFRIAGAVAALIALLSIPQLTWTWFFAIVIVLVAYEVSWIYVAPLENEMNDPETVPQRMEPT